MTAREFLAVLKLAPRLAAAVATGNREALDNVQADVRKAHAPAGSGKGSVRP